jgi:hypothetical protein
VSLVFLDTEFTDFHRPVLLSVGMVSLDGEEFYAQLDLNSAEGRDAVAVASGFVKLSVLNQWDCIAARSTGSREIGKAAGQWILDQASRDGRIVEVASDFSADFELLEHAVRQASLWEAVRPHVRAVNIAPLTGTLEGELAAEQCFGELLSRGLARHHALADALALRAAYLAVRRRSLEIR